MSVQAGIWNSNGEPVNREFLARISQSIAEYGPDGEETYFDGQIGMLYRPFYTTSESRLEHQPQVSSTGKAMTWDGRLDNRDELMCQLHRDILADRTDAAIVQVAFERWGTESFAKLVGDWALAVWDPHSKELILARDYAGVRHLFYYPKPTRIIWCNHLAPLALCGDSFNLSDEYFASYLALWPEAHLTPYREIHSVPPGKYVAISNGIFRTHSYWSFNPGLKTRYKTDSEYEEHFREVFRQAVRQRLRTDSPILADLSGGLDSSSIVCMADDIAAKEVGTPSLDTFSALIRDEPNEEDSFYLVKVEEQRGRIGHHVEIQNSGDMSPFAYASFVATPGFNGREELNTAKSDITKHGKYRVLLSGKGGDELLGQALDPRIQLADLIRELRGIEFVKQLRIWSLLLRRPWMHLFLDALLLQLPPSIRARHVAIAKIPLWVNRSFARRQKLSLRQLNAEASSLWRPSMQDWFQTLITLTRQMAKTRPSTQEIRYPYLDQKLVEFLISIPTQQLLRPGQRRSLMRRALNGLLPPEIASRRTKSSGERYFSVALQKHWNEVANVLDSPVLSELGYIDRHNFQTSLIDVRDGILPRYFTRLSRALSWELWLRNALTQRVVSIEPRLEMSVAVDLVKS